MRLVALLDQLADDGDAGGAQQLLELGEIVALGQRGDAERALLGPAGVPAAGPERDCGRAAVDVSVSTGPREC